MAIQSTRVLRKRRISEPRMTQFPILTLPNELKVQVLDKLDPRDSLKLFKMNRYLRQLITHHGLFSEFVERLEICPDRKSMIITKNSIPVKVDPQKYQSFLSRLRFVRHLSIERGRNDLYPEIHCPTLSQLKEIDTFFLRVSPSGLGPMKIYLEAIKAPIKSVADLKTFEDKPYYHHFLANQLTDCREVKIVWAGACQRLHKALDSTRIQVIELSDASIIQIIQCGIPSQHPDAAVVSRLIRGFQDDSGSESRFIEMLTRHHEIDRVNDEEEKLKMKEMILKTLEGFDTELWVKFHCPLSSHHCFRRRVDERRDMIFVIVVPEIKIAAFFAKYVSNS